MHKIFIKQEKRDDDRPSILFGIFEKVPPCSIHLTQLMNAIECIQYKLFHKNEKKESSKK